MATAISISMHNATATGSAKHGVKQRVVWDKYSFVLEVSIVNTVNTTQDHQHAAPQLL